MIQTKAGYNSFRPLLKRHLFFLVRPIIPTFFPFFFSIPLKQRLHWMLRLNPLYLEQVRVRPPTPPEYKQSSPIKEECDNGALSPLPPPEDELPPCTEATTQPIQEHSNVSSGSGGSGSSNEVLATLPQSIPVPPPPPPKDVSPSYLSTSTEAVSPSCKYKTSWTAAPQKICSPCCVYK